MVLIKELKLLFGGDGKHKLLLSNITWQGLERGARILASVFTGILLAAYLGPGPLGVYSYALSFVLLFAPVISLGYDIMLPRDILYEKDKWDEILGTSAFLRFMGSLLTIGLIWAYTFQASALTHEMKDMIRVLSLSFLFYPFDVFGIWFRVHLQSRNASVSKITALVIVNVLKLYFIWIKMPLIFFGWLYVAEFIVNGILQFMFYVKTEPGKLYLWKATTQRIVFVLKQAWPLLVSSFSLMIYNRIDQVMIGNMLDTTQVGIFAAAGKISEIPIAFIMVFNSTTYTFLADSYKNRPEIFHRQYLIISRIYTVFAYAMLLVVIVGGGYIIAVYPSSFSAASLVLKINFIGLVFIFNSGLRNSYLSLSGNQKFLLYTTVASALFNVALNYVLIPVYGINGAAWASTISEFLSLMFLNVIFQKTRYVFKVQLQALSPFSLFR